MNQQVHELVATVKLICAMGIGFLVSFAFTASEVGTCLRRIANALEKERKEKHEERS